MTEFEYIQAVDLAYATIPGSAMNFITIVFAYIVASFFAGNKLPRIAAVSASIVYSVSLIGPVLAIVTSGQQMVLLQTQYLEVFPEGIFVQKTLGTMSILLVAVTPLLVGWLASLCFMHLHIRKTKAVAE